MSVKTLIAKFEAERSEIEPKLAALKDRADFLDNLLGELRKEAPKGKRGPAKKKADSKVRKPKGGVTVKDAILNVVADAKEPLTPGEIIPAAAKLSGGAVASIRTQINTLTKAGALKQVPHQGRGFKYATTG